MHPMAGLLGANIPVSAIECIASSAGGQGVLEGGAVETALHAGAQRFERCHNAVGSFSIACVGNALAAAATVPFIELGHHHDRFGLAAAADREGPGQGPALDPYGELHATI